MAAQDHLGLQFQLPPLYHGTAVRGLKRLNAGTGVPLYPGMSRSYAVMAHNYVTTDPGEAADYAKHAADKYREMGHEDATPTVYEVKPAKRAVWEPDPNSGPGGWGDGPTRKDAKELMDYGVGARVNLRFRDSLRVAKEHSPDSDEFKEIVDRHMGF